MLSRADILRLFAELNQELARRDAVGELYLVGGAVMTLVLQARPATRDIDAYFKPVKLMREAAAAVATSHNLEEGWLNDAVKGYLSPQGSFVPFWQGSHLQVLTAEPSYLLAMKCLSMRLGSEFHDEADVRYLLRTLNIERYAQAIKIISQYYPIERFPQKTLYLLEELLSMRNTPNA